MGTRLNLLNEAFLTCTQDLCFEQKNTKDIKFHLKSTIFIAIKNRSILHRHVIIYVFHDKD